MELKAVWFVETFPQCLVMLLMRRQTVSSGISTRTWARASVRWCGGVATWMQRHMRSQKWLIGFKSGEEASVPAACGHPWSATLQAVLCHATPVAIKPSQHLHGVPFWGSVTWVTPTMKWNLWELNGSLFKQDLKTQRHWTLTASISCQRRPCLISYFGQSVSLCGAEESKWLKNQRGHSPQ